MTRFELKHSPIKDGKSKIDQWFVYDGQNCQFIVGYSDKTEAQKAVDRANSMAELILED